MIHTVLMLKTANIKYFALKNKHQEKNRGINNPPALIFKQEKSDSA